MLLSVLWWSWHPSPILHLIPHVCVVVICGFGRHLFFTFIVMPTSHFSLVKSYFLPPFFLGSRTSLHLSVVGLLAGQSLRSRLDLHFRPTFCDFSPSSALSRPPLHPDAVLSCPPTRVHTYHWLLYLMPTPSIIYSFSFISRHWSSFSIRTRNHWLLSISLTVLYLIFCPLAMIWLFWQYSFWFRFTTTQRACKRNDFEIQPNISLQITRD